MFNNSREYIWRDLIVLFRRSKSVTFWGIWSTLFGAIGCMLFWVFNQCEILEFGITNYDF